MGKSLNQALQDHLQQRVDSSQLAAELQALEVSEGKRQSKRLA